MINHTDLMAEADNVVCLTATAHALRSRMRAQSRRKFSSFACDGGSRLVKARKLCLALSLHLIEAHLENMFDATLAEALEVVSLRPAGGMERLAEALLRQHRDRK
jgi:hypothetical protein